MRFVAAGLALLVFTALVLAQQPPQPTPVATPEPATFPSALGYAALTLAGTVYATLSGVIAKLWYSLRDLEKARTKEIAALKQELRDEIDKVRDRLETEQRERREEAEKLLREGREIMREVLTTSSQNTISNNRVADALTKLMAGWGGEPT